MSRRRMSSWAGPAKSSSPHTASTAHAAGSDEREDLPGHLIDTHGVLVVTTDAIPGYRVVKVLGMVWGMVVRTRNWGADLAQFIRSVAGGELRYLTTMMYRARNDAAERLVGECLSHGGNAITAVRYDISEVGAMYTQTCAYGTACVIEPWPHHQPQDAKSAAMQT